MLKSSVLFLFVVLLFGFPCISLASSSNELSADIKLADQERGFHMISGIARNLKKTHQEAGCEDNCDTPVLENRGKLNVEDYGPVDPSPTTKASIRPGPIQHGSPLNPYIPKPPSSPTHPRDGG